MSFDWQTEGKTVWEDTPSQSPTPKSRRGRWVAVVAALVLLATAVIFQGLRQRLAQVAGQVEADVLASHAVIHEAAVRGDGEVVLSFLSGRDADWASATGQLAADGLTYGRDGLNLAWLPEQSAAPSVVVAPDLQSAEVTQGESYAIDVGNGLTETVVLAQTAVYRLGNNRWLLSPPEAEFWGASRTILGQYLVVHFPTRDAAVVERLFLRLDDKLGQMCTQLPNFTCPPGFQVDVVFSTEPDALAQANLVGVITAAQAGLRLPTPTLVGLPQSEAAFQALFRGYASLVVATAVTDLVDWRCCEEVDFYQALLNDLLSQLGLRPNPTAER